MVVVCRLSCHCDGSMRLGSDGESLQKLVVTPVYGHCMHIEILVVFGWAVYGRGNVHVELSLWWW